MQVDIERKLTIVFSVRPIYLCLLRNYLFGNLLKVQLLYVKMCWVSFISMEVVEAGKCVPLGITLCAANSYLKPAYKNANLIYLNQYI